MTSLPTPLVEATRLRDAPDLLARIRFLDCRAGPEVEEAFLQQHLLGAVHAHLDRDLSGDTSHPTQGGRHPLPHPDAWAMTVARWGFTPDTPIVVYDASSGALAAARAWWMLTASGHTSVAVLQGGLAAAHAAGLPMAHGPATTSPRSPTQPRPWTRPTVDIATVEQARVDPAFTVIDVRAAPRFAGDAEPIDPIAGHIPGARSAPLTEHLDAHAHFLPPAALRSQLLGVLDGTPPSRAIVHCGSGVTACHTLLALEAAGLPGASLYVGSWSEWCRSDRARIPTD